VRPHRFQDLFYDAVFNFFQSAELLPLFSPWVSATDRIGHPDLVPRGRGCRLELPKAMPAGCRAEPLDTVKEEPGGHAVKHETPAWFAMLVDAAGNHLTANAVASTEMLAMTVPVRRNRRLTND
jgi:hypothetical protein